MVTKITKCDGLQFFMVNLFGIFYEKPNSVQGDITIKIV